MGGDGGGGGLSSGVFFIRVVFHLGGYLLGVCSTVQIMC